MGVCWTGGRDRIGEFLDEAACYLLSFLHLTLTFILYVTYNSTDKYRDLRCSSFGRYEIKE